MKYLRESQKGFERVDRESGVIHAVKVLGPKSRNGRIYDDEAIRKAVPMYEGAVVNLNHQRFKPGEPVQDRPIQDRWGVLKNVRYFEGSVYADLHYIKSHPMTEQLIEAAERFPDTFGLSHDAAGDERVVNGERRVVEVYDVRSVDVVADPATNDGLFESHQRGKAMKKKFRSIVESIKASDLQECMKEAMSEYPEMGDSEIELSDDASEEDGIGSAFKLAMMKVLDDESMDTAGKLAKLKAIMQAKDKAMEAMKTATESMKAENDSMKAENAKMEESVKRLSEDLTKAKGDLDRERCRALLVESQAEITEVRLKALLALTESERPELAKTFSDKRGARPERSGSVLKESEQLTEYPKDHKEFKRLLG